MARLNISLLSALSFVRRPLSSLCCMDTSGSINVCFSYVETLECAVVAVDLELCKNNVKRCIFLGHLHFTTDC